jgi:hypothetical protein
MKSCQERGAGHCLLRQASQEEGVAATLDFPLSNDTIITLSHRTARHGSGFRVRERRPRMAQLEITRILGRHHLPTILCCLFLTPLDGAPLFQAVFAISATTSPKDDVSPDDEDETVNQLGESIPLSRRETPTLSTGLSLKLNLPCIASARAHPLPPRSGCEHALRNGIGAPLRC